VTVPRFTCANGCGRAVRREGGTCGPFMSGRCAVSARKPRGRPFIGGTVDPEVAARVLAVHACRPGAPFAATLEDVLRRGLDALDAPPRCEAHGVAWCRGCMLDALAATRKEPSE
jgi:hypothetical protein